MTHETYYHQRITPCECGSREPYWHGPKEGLREYCCDACWGTRFPKFRYAIEVEIPFATVADGLDFTDPEVVQHALMRAFPLAPRLAVWVTEAPDPAQVRKAQGFKE